MTFQENNCLYSFLHLIYPEELFQNFALSFIIFCKLFVAVKSIKSFV